MYQYHEELNDIINYGTWVVNPRTGVKCLTSLHVQFIYDLSDDRIPVVTSRKWNPKVAIAELLGYLKGFTNANQFKELGTSTWLANADENPVWNNSPYKKEQGDMGKVYGAVAKDWINFKGDSIDTIAKVAANLTNHIDDRGEIITFWNPGEFERGCLRPCMHTHTFSILDGKLYLQSLQRSCDMPLGYVFNAVQCGVLLRLFAQISNLRVGYAIHHITNAHIYENQLAMMKELVNRPIYDAPKLLINPDIKTYQDIVDWVTPNDFEIVGLVQGEPMKIPFTV